MALGRVAGGPFGGCLACVWLFRATDAGKDPFQTICRIYGRPSQLCHASF
jgi:hypothetical protein